MRSSLVDCAGRIWSRSWNAAPSEPPPSLENPSDGVTGLPFTCSPDNWPPE